MVRGALRPPARTQEGDEVERGRGGSHQQEAIQEDREEVQGEAKGGKGKIIYDVMTCIEFVEDYVILKGSIVSFLTTILYSFALLNVNHIIKEQQINIIGT